MRYRWLVVLLLAVPLHAQTAAQSAAASIQYLARAMDEYHDRFPVYDDVSSAGNHFHAYAKIPDGDALVEMNGSWTATKHSGATAIRCEYHANTPSGFAGFYLQNGTLTGTETTPLANFGTVPNAGIDLTGATTLNFWARGEAGGEQVELFLAGVGHPPSPQPYPDSSPRRPAQGTRTTLTTQWTQYSINLTGADLSYVLGGFGWVADSVHNPGGAVFYLDDIEYVLSPERKNQRLNEPRFIRSFTTLPLQPDPFDLNTEDDIDFVLRNLAFTYDNALAVLAFLADGSSDSVRRARLIGDAFVRAIQHDVKFNDNRACDATVSPLTDDGARLRTAYAAGDVALPPGWTPNGRSGTVPFPGFYRESNETFYVVEQSAVDTGNNAWAMLALLALHQQTAEPSYLGTACKIGNFIHAFRNDTGTYQGFTGGVSYYPDNEPASLRPWASSEHNLDVYAAFLRMHHVTGDARWLDDAEHARALVDAMWNGATSCYLAGTTDPFTRNTTTGQLPLDVQAWSVLALPNAPATDAAVLNCAEANHLTSNGGFTGFDFNNDKDGVWFEGTAQMAVAYALAGEPVNAETYRQVLRNAQANAPNADAEGVVAASRDALTTGFETPRADPFKYFRRLHAGATSWNVFAQLGVNPYYEPFGTPTSLDAHFNGTAAAIAWNAVPGAVGYEVSRNDSYTIQTTALNTTDATISAGSAYLYRVRATGSGANPSAWSAHDLMTAVSFTDDPIAAFSTVVKAVHVTQLRSAVNSVRALASLGLAAFTNPSLAGAPVRAVHINELRTALGAARATLGLPAISFAHPTLSIVRAVDVGELRDGVD
jgi:hypothetical protein